MARIKELHVSHEGSSQSIISNQERVSTLERSVVNASGPPEETQQPFCNLSMSWTMQSPEENSAAEAQTSASVISTSNITTPQSSPPDFSSFFTNSARDIPNINCRTHGTSGLGSGLTESISCGPRSQQIPLHLLSTANNPVEIRHPVKVINIPAEFLSDGSVPAAAAQSNTHNFNMNPGDSENACASTLPVMHQYGPSPNESQNYKSELLTETQTSQSSSTVVNTSNHSSPNRKPNTSFNVNDSPGSRRRTLNPPLTLNTDFLSNSEPGNVNFSEKLSIPIQASSPGIAHSKPVFVELISDRLSAAQLHYDYNGINCSSSFNVRPPPINSKFFPNQGNMFGFENNSMNYTKQFNVGFPNTTGFPVCQQQNEHLYDQQRQKPLDFHSLPSNLFQLPSRTGYGSTLHSQFSTPANLTGYPLIPDYFSGKTSSRFSSKYFPGQTPSSFSRYTPMSPNIGQASVQHLSKNTNIGQHSLGSRSSSQDSEHKADMDYDAHHPPYLMGSHVSSLISGSSSSLVEEVVSNAHPLTETVADEAEYVKALTQHQTRQMQKLMEEANQHKEILIKLRSEVCDMEKNMIETSHVSRSFPSIEDISSLCENNRRLQTDIQLYMNEIEMYKSGQIPVNKISPHDQQNFFENMPTGQQDPICPVFSNNTISQLILPPRPPPPRPPPPLPSRQRSTDIRHISEETLASCDIFRAPPVPSSQPIVNSGDSEEGESWNCTACTFSNHPALKKCEICEMSRVVPHKPTSTLDLQNITTHQTLPSLPPRLAPGFGLVGTMHSRSGSPHTASGGHLPHACEFYYFHNSYANEAARPHLPCFLRQHNIT